MNAQNASPNLIDFYREAKKFCIEQGYEWEIDIVFKRTWEQIQPDYFFAEYVFVVLNAGMRNQVAQKIYDNFMATMDMNLSGNTIQETADARIKSLDVSIIGHEGKRKAIHEAIIHYQEWFKELQNITSESHAKAQGWDKYKDDPRRKLMYKYLIQNTQKLSKSILRVGYLGTLPWIGKITKFHLARNLGIDVAKPDRHLVRLCAQFGFGSAQEMCTYISQATGDRVGVVDVVLWRNANLKARKQPTIT